MRTIKLMYLFLVSMSASSCTIVIESPQGQQGGGFAPPPPPPPPYGTPYGRRASLPPSNSPNHQQQASQASHGREEGFAPSSPYGRLSQIKRDGNHYKATVISGPDGNKVTWTLNGNQITPDKVPDAAKNGFKEAMQKKGLDIASE